MQTQTHTNRHTDTQTHRHTGQKGWLQLCSYMANPTNEAVITLGGEVLLLSLEVLLPICVYFISMRTLKVLLPICVYLHMRVFHMYEDVDTN